MNIPKGYKLVPVELLERIAAYAPEGFCAPTALQGFAIEAGWILAAAPTPPQPIYDEAKERELFEAWAYSVCHVPYGWLGREYFKRMGDHYEDDYAHGLWQGWKAHAQSGAKSVEVGHE